MEPTKNTQHCEFWFKRVLQMIQSDGWDQQ